jgi:hypothetical protein
VPPESTSSIWLCNGRLHLTCAAYERHLSGCVAVALLARDREWLLLPLHAGAGGLQVKLRNARGDRVVESQEFFRSQGIEDSDEIQPLDLRGDPARGLFLIARSGDSNAR